MNSINSRPEYAYEAVFIGRDGVVNVRRDDYVKSWEEFEFRPGVFDSLARLRANGFTLVLMTNQPAVGRGIISPDTLDGMHVRMQEELARNGAEFDAIYPCPHTPEDGCDCHMPAPGLMLRAMRDLALEPDRTCAIGDAWSDAEAAALAGCGLAMLISGARREAEPVSFVQSQRNITMRLQGLSAAVDHILSTDSSASELAA